MNKPRISDERLNELVARPQYPGVADCGCIECEALLDLRDCREELAAVTAERDGLARDERLFVPGNWKCPKCSFFLSRTTLDVANDRAGTTRADREETEPCPNGCGDLVRESWEEWGKGWAEGGQRRIGELCDEGERLRERVRELGDVIVRWRESVWGSCVIDEVEPIYDGLKKERGQ